MLAYCTYKVVLVVRFICGDLGCDRGNECIGRHASHSGSTSVVHVLYYDIVDFIGS